MVSSYTRYSTRYSSYGKGQPEDPLYLFNNPLCWRFLLWLVPIAVIAGIALIVTFVVNVEDQQIGLIMGGGVLLFFSIAVSVITSAKCCAVGSVRYYMLPCTMSQQELEALKNQCQAKHDKLFGKPASYTNELNPVQNIAQPMMQQNIIYSAEPQQSSPTMEILKTNFASEITIPAVM
ncbi:Hypothetical_protein [Hexamita inflata]|uniref:Hypothetical_protein n=1 Tax=Hexamita inflata TaxID=28002 RepID=A0AA86QGB9_9EUKA|nr:Hypothetical protein HINF_LOCUS43856 [Hexamita inflata]